MLVTLSHLNYKQFSFLILFQATWVEIFFFSVLYSLYEIEDHTGTDDMISL